MTVTIPSSSSHNFDFTDAVEGGVAVVTVTAAYHASASAGVSITPLYSWDNSTFDTDGDSETHPFTAGSTISKTYFFPSYHPYFRVKVENSDSSYSVDVDVVSKFYY